ncbi:hypothetical protein, conserved in T. vivax [Trypanosoma vivax Y486]|uniref:Uncharacterized protein n=1 Tax=Trypanosoma vivax (strain Y486) TaxID=1055687 RepID=F9WPZ4_TRYVY|nr:hypothetical protein, conserved in T. vivax [Trypanosoma vivax Y486]|eukprot:CCD19621.1 hypothetical protein, conserved in T. vivax [Trypanosoma vivax Y486]
MPHAREGGGAPQGVSSARGFESEVKEGAGNNMGKVLSAILAASCAVAAVSGRALGTAKYGLASGDDVTLCTFVLDMRDAQRIALDVSGKAAAAAFAVSRRGGKLASAASILGGSTAARTPARQRVARAEEEAKALATALGQHADAARSSALLFVYVAAGVEALVGIAGSIVDTNAGSGIVKTCLAETGTTVTVTPDDATGANNHIRTCYENTRAERTGLSVNVTLSTLRQKMRTEVRLTTATEASATSTCHLWVIAGSGQAGMAITTSKTITLAKVVELPGDAEAIKIVPAKQVEHMDTNTALGEAAGRVAEAARALGTSSDARCTTTEKALCAATDDAVGALV